MLKKLILFIKNLFSLSDTVHKEDFIADKSYSDVVRTPASKIKEQMEALKKNNIAHSVVNPQQPVKLVKKTIIEKKIIKNINFIDNLMQQMEGVATYNEYYKKLKDLKTQSHNSLRILFRIKEEAPYYYNTIVAIMQHTKVIAGLLIE